MRAGLTALKRLHKLPVRLDNIVQPPRIELSWALFEEINADMMPHNPLTHIAKVQYKKYLIKNTAMCCKIIKTICCPAINI